MPRPDAKKAFLASLPITFLALVTAVGYKVWTATLLDKETLALFFTAMDIFAVSLLILVGFRSSMVVAYARTHDDLHILNIFRLILLVAVLLAWGAVIPYLKHILGVDVDYWYLVAALLGMGLWTYLGNQLAMYRLYGAINRATLLEPALALLWFAVAWYGYEVRGLQALFVGTVTGSLTLSLYLFWVKFRHKVKEPPLILELPDTAMRTFLRNSVISTVEFGSGIVMIYLAVFLLLSYHGPAELGDFQMVVKPVLMGLIALFVFPVFRFFLPELSRLVSANDYDGIVALKSWYVKFAAACGMGLVLFFILFGQWFVATLFPPEYTHAYLMLVHLILFFPFVMLNALQLTLIKAAGHFTQALIVRVAGVAIFACTFFILRFFSQSVVDVVLGLSLGYFGMFMLSLVLERRVMRILKKTGKI
jgi:O-antigen/teichoic acid export membrane protein